jgi:acetate kinase
MSLLVLNAGLSSLKFGLFDAEAREQIVSGDLDWGGPAVGRRR